VVVKSNESIVSESQSLEQKNAQTSQSSTRSTQNYVSMHCVRHAREIKRLCVQLLFRRRCVVAMDVYMWLVYNAILKRASKRDTVALLSISRALHRSAFASGPLPMINAIRHQCTSIMALGTGYKAHANAHDFTLIFFFLVL